jgi:hypothetical protein
MTRALAGLVCVLALALAVPGCGSAVTSGGNFCPEVTISFTCATPDVVPCRDAHGNTCIGCSGSGAKAGCLYDPSAPVGANAVCVAKCSDCGGTCKAFY